MNSELKKITISFILMLIFNLGAFYLINNENFGGGYSPHVGLIFISGLLLGPYGALGSVVGNLLCDLIRGYTLPVAILSGIVSFGISYLGYKLWYSNFKGSFKIKKPKLNNTSTVLLFISIIIICGILYALIHKKLFYLLYPNTIPINFEIGVRYFVNFINSSFIFGIIGIWISNKFNLFHTPKKSKKQLNKRLYNILGILLVISNLIILITDNIFNLNNSIVAVEIILIVGLLFAYLTKPVTSTISEKNQYSITERIMNIFLLTTLLICVLGYILSLDYTLVSAIDNYFPLSKHEIVISMMVLMDILLLIFFIPSLAVLRYIENKVVKPIISFSKIEKFIEKNQKIESEGLVKIYSNYINENNEIGTLARSYTKLIKNNNEYIENIRKIEGEKERIKTELDIARKIQQSNLPREAIKNEYFTVNGYSQPAKEVGGDFFDYYNINEDNLAIVIGDVSGKGIPAALLATTTQSIIKELFKSENDPSKILYTLNNQVCENNSEVMFITMWLGIYNKSSKTLTFSNAGHNPPIIKENGKFNFLKVDEGIVLGIIEDFKFKNETVQLNNEIIIYTDGIIDANNKNNKRYGEKNLLNFFNTFKWNYDPIKPLLNDINNFVNDCEQFDDMTILYLKIEND